MVLFDIIIPTFNQSTYTIKCFESIMKYSRNHDYRIIWIDNESDTMEYISVHDFLNKNIELKAKVIDYRNQENLGFVKGTNMGIAISTAPYVVFMNNDTEAVEGWLDKLLNVFQREPDAGVVGPLCSIGASWQNIDNIRNHIDISVPCDKYLETKHMVAFFCAMIKREVIKKVGYLSEDFGIGLGDDDWYCEQVRRSGFRIFVTLNCVIPHYHRTTFKSLYKEEEIKDMQEKAIALFYSKKEGLLETEGAKIKPYLEKPLIEPDNSLKIFFLVGDMGGSGALRIFTPAIYLEQRCNNIKVVVDETTKNPFLLKSDVIVLQRAKNEEAISFIQGLRSEDKKVVYETDDDLWHIPPDNNFKSFYQPQQLRIMEKIIASCDAVTVSTEPLAEQIRKFNKNVHVLPNSMEFDSWMDDKQEKGDQIRIGWAGGHQHNCDLKVCHHVLLEIAERYKNKIQLVFMGMMPDDFMGIAEHYPFIPYQLYMGELQRLKLDIGVLPLAENRFNHSKSSIKYVEFSALHIASIASPVYPYLNTIIHNETGLIVKKNRYGEWIKALTSLIEDDEIRHTLAEKANKYVKENFNIQYNIKRWEKVYRNL